MIINSFIFSVKNLLVAQDVVMFSMLGVSVLSFAVFFALSLTGVLPRIKRLYFLLIVFATLIVQAITALAAQNRWASEILFFPVLTLGINLILFAVLMAFSSLRVKVKKEHKDLINLIDRELKVQKLDEVCKAEIAQDSDGCSLESTAEKILPKPLKDYQKSKQVIDKVARKKSETDKQRAGELDFSHVKNIIARLDFYSLSPTEKRQVEQLKGLVNKAEGGECDLSLKSSINDGLGTLLKIMSKYGV